MKKEAKGKIQEMGSLPDPKSNRQCKDIVPPAHELLLHDYLYPSGNFHSN